MWKRIKRRREKKGEEKERERGEKLTEGRVEMMK